jgi:hypothetical protein
MEPSAASQETKTPSTRRGFAHTKSLPAPYQLAIEDTAFRMTVLDDRVGREVDHDVDDALVPPAWFSVTIAASTRKRFLYLVQKETGTGIVALILLFDRSTTGEDSDGLRLPPSGGWMRAAVDGVVSVLASDLVLTRKSIAAWIGGYEPPTPTTPPRATLYLTHP